MPTETSPRSAPAAIVPQPASPGVAPRPAPSGVVPRLAPLRFGLGAGLSAAVRGLALAVVALAGFVPLAVILAAAGLVAFGPGYLIIDNGNPPESRVLLAVLVTGAGAGLAWSGVPKTLLGQRRLASLTRGLAGRWCGVPIADPYRPLPPDRDTLSFARLFQCLARDPATWRDLLWITVNLVAAWALAAASAVIIGIGLIGFIGPEFLKAIPPPAFPGNNAGALIVLGLGIIATGVAAAPRLLTGYASVAGPPAGTDPAGRAGRAGRAAHRDPRRRLDTAAAELRRIERDLHDGAQARLVAMGMTLAPPTASTPTLWPRGHCCPRPVTPRSTRWPTCATWSAASTRRSWPTVAWSPPSRRSPWTCRCGQPRRRPAGRHPRRSSQPPTSRSASC